MELKHLVEFDKARTLSNDVKRKGLELFDFGKQILQNTGHGDEDVKQIFTQLGCSDGHGEIKAFYGTDLIEKGYRWMLDNILRKKEEGGDYFPKLVYGY